MYKGAIQLFIQRFRIKIKKRAVYFHSGACPDAVDVAGIGCLDTHTPEGDVVDRGVRDHRKRGSRERGGGRMAYRKKGRVGRRKEERERQSDRQTDRQTSSDL